MSGTSYSNTSGSQGLYWRLDFGFLGKEGRHVIPKDCLAGFATTHKSFAGVLGALYNFKSASGKGTFLLFFILLSCRGIYVQPHTHTQHWRTAIPASAQARFVSSLRSTTTKFRTKEKKPCTLLRLHFNHALFSYCRLAFDSIGRPGRAGTSSPHASPSRTWEGGRSMRRCGSGAGDELLACVAFDIIG